MGIGSIPLGLYLRLWILSSSPVLLLGFLPILVQKGLGSSIKISGILAPQDFGLPGKPRFSLHELLRGNPGFIQGKAAVVRVIVGLRNGRPEGEGQQEDEKQSKEDSGGKHCCEFLVW